MKEGSQRVPVKQAALEIGCSENILKMRMKTGEWNLGIVEYNPQNPKKKYKFMIFRAALDKFLMKPVNE